MLSARSIRGLRYRAWRRWPATSCVRKSVASSQIEGLRITQRRLAEALFAPDLGDVTARSVINNITAMEAAVNLGSAERPITMMDIQAIHQTLLNTPEDVAIAGVVRTTQNWIGGRTTSPLGAQFIPPPPEEIAPLLDDLCVFINRDDLPAVAQAAITHAQFETIHPFADGNGRVGRCLIHVCCGDAAWRTAMCRLSVSYWPRTPTPISVA